MLDRILVGVLVASGATVDAACAGFVYQTEARNVFAYGETPATPFPIQTQDYHYANGFGDFDATADIGSVRATQQSTLGMTGFRVSGFVGDGDPVPGGIATGLSRFDVTFTLTTATAIRFHGTSASGNTDCWLLQDSITLFAFSGGALDRTETLAAGTYRFYLTIYGGTDTYLPGNVNSSMDLTAEQIPAPATLAMGLLLAAASKRRR